MMATCRLPVVSSPRLISSDAVHVQGSSTPARRMRRRTETPPTLSSPEMTSMMTSSQPMIVGQAHLCFSEDGSWFEGHLIATTEDQSQYGLVGVLNSESDSTTYDVSVLDHDDGETYSVGSVILTFTPDIVDVDIEIHNSGQLCSLVSSNLKFSAKKSFRGQMADMLIQRYLTPRLVGEHLRVYVGQMSVDIARLETLDRPSEKRMWYN